MTEATLRFRLPEDREDFRHAQRGGDYFNMIFEWNERLRRMLKDGDCYEGIPVDAIGAVERVREAWFELLEARGINLEE